MPARHVSAGRSCFRRGKRCLQWALFAFVVAAVSTIAGCKSTRGDALLKPSLGALSGLKKKSPLDDRATIDGVMGPTERKLKQASWEAQTQEATAAGEVHRIEGLAEYQAAEKIFQAGRYAEAEKAFKKLAKDRRHNGLSFGERIAESFQGSSSNPINSIGDPVEEDALFMIAESQYMQKKYSWAQDSYDRLLEKYPSSRHMDKVTRRLFTIAQAWMGFPGANSDDNVELASTNLQKTNPRVGDKSFERPSFVNVTDRSRPVFDTAGRALQALQSIWLNDANGPLADDALMLTANYHLQTGNFIEAARVYQLLREQYPDSPHFKDAYLLDSHVRLASYDGPAYDDRALQESRELRETAQRLFPDLSDEQRARLEDELKRIEVSEVAREWHKVTFYQSKGRGYETSVILHCNVILNKYPDSVYAQRARKVLEQTAAEVRENRTSPLNFLDRSRDMNSPVLMGLVPPEPRNQTAQRETPTPSPVSTPSQEKPPASAKTRQPSGLRRLLTPTQTPRLQPVRPPETPVNDNEEGQARPDSLSPSTPEPRRSLF